MGNRRQSGYTATPVGARPAALPALLLLARALMAQTPSDTLPPTPGLTGMQELEKVVVLPTAPGCHAHGDKPLGALDSYLAESNSVNMIRRGCYAWEPMLNGMATERSMITVDGMRIYGACTDKMDPVTSYVETANLSRARIRSGTSGGEHGGTIAGSIDLERRRSGFSATRGLGGSTSAGFETNNLQRILGTALHYASPALYTDVDFTFRQAGNYRAGHRPDASNTVDFSQFTKYNLSAIAGYRPGEGKEVEASVIFDKATDVGYPGLPMDVSLAQALIGSVQYRHLPRLGPVSLWETKLYYNTITHVMDDSRRPVVPIRMDMPGWSTTEGFYTKLYASAGRHAIKATLSGHRNNSLAEMTMYPHDPAEPVMFMLTWPDVRTLYSGLNAEDRIRFNDRVDLTVHAGLGIHGNTIGSEFGRRSLELFYVSLPPRKQRWLPSGGATITHRQGRFTHRLGAGYSERAPSVSEGYGFYLLNANDNHDYVGDPRMRNEGSLSAELGSRYQRDKVFVEWTAAWFHLVDYIIGRPHPELMPMNITASGVKVYEQIPYATLFNTGLNAEYRFNETWQLRGDASWRYGEGSDGTRLPLIQPLQFRTKLRYARKQYAAEATVEGSTRNRPSLSFGETSKPGFLIGHLSVSREFAIRNHRLGVNMGVDNILDQYYTTFSDWFGIPRMGRNVYAHVVYVW
ncbi:MAG: TonB-dependent receptor [Flavobacteriales bacterium]|nr:TonB-dependent receptor [Flavobacteriales bacterium]